MAAKTATSKKPNRLQNHTRPLGVIRQHPDALNHNNDRLSMESYVKKPVPPVDVLPPRKISHTITNHSKGLPESSLVVDHSQCTESINQLKQQIEKLKEEYCQLDTDFRKTSAELSNWKLENENLTKENQSLKYTKETLENDISIVKKNFNRLDEEFTTSRDQWKIEQMQLEKSLNEIRKELENKIIEIRNKHSQEIQVFEEKIRVLKTHLADTLNLRSIERQYEIDRISEELKKSQENEDHMRIRLKKLVDKFDSMEKNKAHLCGNCMQPLDRYKGKQNLIPNINERKNSEELRLDKKLTSHGKLKTEILKSINNKN